MPADSNRGSLAWYPETTFGTASTSAAYKEIPFSSESLRVETDVVSSQLIRADRQKTGVFRTGLRSSGDISTEFAYSTFWDDAFLYGTMADASWGAAKTVTGSMTFSATDQSITSSGTDFSTTFKVGDIVQIKGTASNNGPVRVVGYGYGAGSNDKLIVSGRLLVSETISCTVTHSGVIANGVTLTSHSIERGYADISGSGAYDLFVGQCLSSIGLSTDGASLVTGSLSFMGKSSSSQTAKRNASAYVSAGMGETFSAVDNIVGLHINAYSYPAVVSTSSGTLITTATAHALKVGDTVIFWKSATGTVQAVFPAITTVLTVPSSTTFTTALSPASAQAANVVSVARISTSATLATSYGLTLNNNLHPRDRQFNTLGPASMGSGTIDLGGTLSAYYADATHIDRYLNFYETSVEAYFQDSLGQGYGMLFPKCRLTVGDRPIPGQNTDVIVNYSFEAYRDSQLVTPNVNGTTIRINRYA